MPSGTGYDGPLSSVNPGEDWEGDHGDDPDPRSPEDPIRIRFLLGHWRHWDHSAGARQQGNRARRPWILVIPAGVAGVAWPYPGESRVPIKTRNPGIGDPSWIKENLGQSPLPVGR
jgi:hypothetical protein